MGKIRAGEPCAVRLILFGALDRIQILLTPGLASLDNPARDTFNNGVQGKCPLVAQY